MNYHQNYMAVFRRPTAGVLMVHPVVLHLTFVSTEQDRDTVAEELQAHLNAYYETTAWEIESVCQFGEWLP